MTERKNRIVDEYFGFASANVDLQNIRGLQWAIAPAIIPYGGAPSDGSVAGSYRTTTGAVHSGSTTTITDNGLPDGTVSFQSCLANPDTSGDDADYLGHFFVVFDPTQNLYQRFRITAINSATEIEVYDPGNALGGGTWRYRVTYNSDRAERFGHTHDGIDSVPIGPYNDPYYDDSGTPTPYRGPVLIKSWDASTNAVTDDPVSLSEVTNGAPNLGRVRFRVEFLFTAISQTALFTLVIKTASGGIKWDIKTASAVLPSTVARNTAGPAVDWYFMAIDPSMDATVVVDGSGSTTRYCYQDEFEIEVEGATIYADVADLTQGSISASISLYCLGFTNRKPGP